MKIDLSQTEAQAFLDSQRATNQTIVSLTVQSKEWERKYYELDRLRAEQVQAAKSAAEKPRIESDQKRIEAETKLATLQGQFDALTVKHERMTKAFTPDQIGQWSAHDDAQRRQTVHDWVLQCRTNKGEATKFLQSCFMNGAASLINNQYATDACGQLVYYLPATLK